LGHEHWSQFISSYKAVSCDIDIPLNFVAATNMAGCDRFNCLEISIAPPASSASPRLAEASFKWSGLSFKTLGKSVKLVSRSKLLLNKIY
jgi:hypothetical protein